MSKPTTPLKETTPGNLRLSTDCRRRSERTPHVMESWICSPTARNPAEDREEVISLNLSRHGIGFNSPAALAAGSFYILEVGIGKQALVSEIRIVSCRPSEEQGFEVGAEFC